jgi:hypothetical protein
MRAVCQQHQAGRNRVPDADVRKVTPVRAELHEFSFDPNMRLCLRESATVNAHSTQLIR